MTNQRTESYRTGLSKRIWLHLLKEGGLFTPDELAQEFGAPRQIVALAMHNMVGRSGALHKVKVGNRAKFGVTQTCALPYGLTLEDLAQAGLRQAP